MLASSVQLLEYQVERVQTSTQELLVDSRWRLALSLSLPVWTRSVAFLCPRELTPALEDCCSATAWILLDEKRQNLNQA